MSRVLRAATAHISPHILSSKRTTEKVIRHINLAAKQDANLVAFPESFIPAFPFWSTFLAPAKAHHLFQHMVQESIYADGEEINAIRDAAAGSKIIVSLGFTEKVRYSTGTLFNSNLIIGSQGEILVHHRKLVPTWVEKLTWAAGDGHGLKVADTQYGKIGALICGENTNPLARYTMIAQGEQVHISTWPPIWASRIETFEGPDSSDTTLQTNINSNSDSPDTTSHTNSNAQPNPKNYDNVAANRTRAAAHCFEAKCFGIMSAAFMSEENIKDISALTETAAQTQRILQGTSKGASMFIDPTGAQLMGFTVDTTEHHPQDHLQHEEGLLYADLDLEQCIEGKQYHDVIGGYQRFDVFSLKVNRHRQSPVTFDDGPKS